MPAPGTQNSPRTQRKNPRDLTGTRKAQLEAEVAEEQARAAEEMSLASAAAAVQRQTEVVDYSRGGVSAPGLAPQTREASVADEIEVEQKAVRIRVNSPVEDMVFGREVIDHGDAEKGLPPVLGNLQFYSFEEGVAYMVPLALAEHLDRIGYLYH